MLARRAIMPVLLANGARVVIGSTTLMLVAFDTP